MGLLRVKRVEHILTHTWMRHTHQAHVLRDRPEFEAMCRKSYFIRNEMTNFVRNFHSYLMFEVLECTWKNFCERLDSANNLSDLIYAHNSYLDEIHTKAFLGGEDCKL